MLPPVILVVDDLDIVRSLCKNALQTRGFDVLEAPNGVQALETFEHRRESIVLALVDISMPGMDGFDVARAMLLRKTSLAIVLISGANTERMVPPDLQGRCFTLNKPFTVNVLRDVVARALGRANAACAGAS